MRVLIVRRVEAGGLASHSEVLAEALDAHGIEAVVDDAASWIPDKTGWSVDRLVTKSMRSAAKGFDLVHAMGYRTAWACAEALAFRSPWVYTAHDLPKTTLSDLIDRLNLARCGICSSPSVQRALSRAGAENLEVVAPGVRHRFFDVLPEPAADTRRILSAGRPTAERGMLSLATAWTGVPRANLTLAVLGDAPQELRDAAARSGAGIIEGRSDVAALLAHADLAVVSSARQGFSLFAAEAMAAGVPVLMRRSMDTDPLVREGETGFMFNSDEELPGRIVEVLDQPLARESVSRAARLEARERFFPINQARRHAEIYRSALGA